MKRKEKKAKRETDVPERDKSWEVWKMALSRFAIGAELAVNAAAEGLQRRTEMMER